jgi:hypothetical protein
MITASGMEEMGYQAFVVSEAGLIDELLLGSHELPCCRPLISHA